MHAKQEETTKNITEVLKQDPGVRALLLGGSIAHGFENDTSDVDVLIVIDEAAYEEKVKIGRVTYRNVDVADYPEGYVDGKFITLSFIRQVAEKGSEPARFAFKDARILFSHIDGLEKELEAVVKYPIAEKEARIMRFTAQLAAWRWYCGEAMKKQNKYLLGVAVSKLVLFGGRLILAQNEMLYPFHKWLLAVLEQAPDKPVGMLEAIERLHSEPSAENIEAFFQMIKGYRVWDEYLDWERWGSRFMKDVELTWMDDRASVDEL